MTFKIVNKKPVPVKISPRKEQSQQLNIERLSVTKNEAAALLGVSPRSLFNWAKRGTIPSFKAGNKLMFTMKSIHDFINGVEPTGNTLR